MVKRLPVNTIEVGRLGATASWGTGGGGVRVGDGAAGTEVVDGAGRGGAAATGLPEPDGRAASQASTPAATTATASAASATRPDTTVRR
jgi:hypothetical protein